MSQPSPTGSPVERHPVATFLVVSIGLTWAVQLTFLALGLPLFPALMVELIVLVTTAAVVTRMTEGREGVRRLFSGVVRWRFGPAWYAVALVAMPVLTILVAAVAGTLQEPDGGVVDGLLQYLFVAIVFGALLGNVWEETAWTGFMQARLALRSSPLVAALVTAVPFALIHFPLAFEEHGLTGTGLVDVAAYWGLLIVIAPFFRYLIGLVHAHTGGSLLAVGLLHGSFNASGGSSMVTGGWEYIPAMVILSLGVAAYHLQRSRSQAAAPTEGAPA